MRMPLTLDEDVLIKARAVAGQLRIPFKNVINEALRLGLIKVEKPAKKCRYRTDPSPMGLRKGISLDNIQELLSQAEGEIFR